MPKRQRPASSPARGRSFHLEFRTAAQKLAWATFQQHEILFMLGPAGVGKSYLAMAFAINEVLARRKSRIVLTRPIVEAGESLGFLPGTFDEKVEPYITPLFDCLTKLVGPKTSAQRDLINQSIEIAPLAYLRGRTLDDAVCILDEAQNATRGQMKMYITRLGENAKMIINGDPMQSDLPGPVALSRVAELLADVEGIGSVTFKNDSIVRNPILAKVLERL